MESEICDCPKMNMNRDAIPRLQRMLPIRKDFDVAKAFQQQTAQAQPSEKVLMIPFQQTPGHNPPVMQVWKNFHIGDREERATSDHPGNFTHKNLWLSHMLEHLDTNPAIPFAVGARQDARFKMDLANGQPASQQNVAAM